ncbi:MAG: GNAT family N-acetyltransferase [bacterium]
MRTLLTTCFTNPGDEVFRSRRYFIEPPAHRWYVQNANGLLIAHVAAHEKTIIWRDRELPLCGIAEVCVHPDHRRQGFVRQMLEAAHDFMAKHEFDFSALCGDPDIYRSSGYFSVHNLVYRPKEEIKPLPGAMVCELGNNSWPEEDVFLVGDVF